MALKIESCNRVGYAALDPNRSMGPGIYRRVGSGTVYDLIPEPDPAINGISTFQNIFTFSNCYLYTVEVQKAKSI